MGTPSGAATGRAFPLTLYIFKQLHKSASLQKPQTGGCGTTFGEGWNPTKVKDVEKQSLLSKIYRACKEWQGWEGKDNSSCA